ncbi:hypothetical protein IMX26_13155 [Clostridium sp. 'deep sea']|uniref:hypothetical protein n=1 Tax=Clostridium sp. 'deep sea' TaxID=2779445 RepID=UPI001896515C|nr:hypothetical protein [Clostridium sp. 'deep sea']QOR34431.1 hypothetical protein IMX26_13155 [Clostridium sp. 'deep sea']
MKTPSAFISNVNKLLDYGFNRDFKCAYFKKPCYYRVVKHPVYLIVLKNTKELKLVTPNGFAAFIDAHKDKFQDLIDSDLVKFVG